MIVVGETQRNEIAEFGVAPLKKLVPIPLGLPLESFVCVDQHRGALREEIGRRQMTHSSGSSLDSFRSRHMSIFSRPPPTSEQVVTTFTSRLWEMVSAVRS